MNLIEADMQSEPHRKRIKHFHEPGDFHELTFSCYRRMKLLANDRWRGYLARNIDSALIEFNFQLTAFVFMPEHVHLLVLPLNSATAVEDISRFLGHLKVKTSQQVKTDLTDSGSRLLDQLTIRDRPDSTSFRFWQEGPGYDRNLQHESTVLAAID